MKAGAPPLAEVLRRAIESGLRGLFVAVPGTVLSYSAATGLASVRPGVRRVVAPTAPGQEETLEALPDVQGVRVLWPGGGGFGLHAPLAEGDQVLLVVCDGDPAGFFRTGEVSDPQDRREHVLANAVALAGFDLPGHAEGAAMTLGHADAPVRLTSARMEVDGSSDAAALASKLDALIFAIRSTWTPVANDGGAALKALIGTLFPVVTGDPGPFTGLTTTGSTKVKTGG